MTSLSERIELIEKAMEGVTPGPWKVFDGCSWRRIGTVGREGNDCAVLAPTKASDGHPDLTCARGNDLYANLNYIADCNPVAISELLAAARKAEALERRAKEAEASSYKPPSATISVNGCRRHAPASPGAMSSASAADVVAMSISPTQEATMTNELVEKLRDPEYAGCMQHLRSYDEIDRLFNQAADLIESLRADLAEQKAAHGDCIKRNIALAGDNAALRAEKDEIRKAVIEEAAAICDRQAKYFRDLSIDPSCLSDIRWNSKEEARHTMQSYAERHETDAAAIRNMGDRT